MVLKKLNAWVVSGLGLGLMFWLSCEKPMVPKEINYSNLTHVLVTDLYYNPNNDSVMAQPPSNPQEWQKNLAFKISFDKQWDTWDRAFDNQVVLYNIYRKPANDASGNNGNLIARSFGSTDLLMPGVVYTYKDSLGKIDSILFTDSNFVIDIINDRTSEGFTYGVASVTGLQVDAEGVDFARGVINPAVYDARSFALKRPMRISIENEAAYSADREVIVSGLFDTKDVDTLYYYRYSEILPMDTLETWLKRIADHRSDTSSFTLKATPKGPLSLQVLGGEDLLLNAVDTARYPYGRLGRVETIPKAGFASFFSTFSIDSLGMAAFTLKDSLVTGPGRKWIMLRPVSRDSAKTLWSPLYDDIRIAPCAGNIALDLESPDLRNRFNAFENSRCVLSDALPVEFDTYGDTTFSDSVYIWLATRNLTSDFFQGLDGNEIKDTKVKAYYPFRDKDSSFPDCILETPETLFRLNAYGKASGLLTADFEQGFRVSPLVLRSDSLDIGSLTRSNADPSGLALSIRSGSILGYPLSALDAFAPCTVYTFSGSGVNRRRAPGWHSVTATPASSSPYLSEIFLSYYNVLYVNPLRHLPINVPSAKRGTKEFILLAYVKGKNFGEPRVFISKYSSPLKYVWDKTPPHITWSEQYNPFISKYYAPLYYHDAANSANDRITDLNQLGKIFDVWLDPATSDDELTAGVRDAEIGRAHV
jgi:hypothetical protein